MINKTPTGWTGWLENKFGNETPSRADVYDTTCWRVSALLGPDGQPLMVSVPKQKIGFHVDTSTTKKGSTK
jgi:hypothetical protein